MQNKKNEFAEHLRDCLGSDDVAYVTKPSEQVTCRKNPEEQVGPMALHLSKFAFDEKVCSRNGPVQLHKSLTLLDHISKDGFVSSLEPVLARKPQEAPLSLMKLCKLH